MAVLYRKYRPQTFAGVLGQKPIIQTLKNQVKSGSVAHAYLFTGSRGVGKTSVARILAKAVNCSHTGQRQGTRDEGDADGVCDICKQIEAGNFIDLVEIDAASNTGVDNIRDLIEHVKFAPSLGKYKVFIIDEVHMLSKGAFNALLKTLEEPPKHAIFILATTEINKVPATIVSRTQRFEFKAYSVTELKELLQKVADQENLKIASETLGLVAENAEGGARDALSLLGKLATLGSDATVKEVEQLLGITDVATCAKLLEMIADAQAEKIPNFYQELFEGGSDHAVFNRDFLEYLRKALVYKISAGQSNFSLSEEQAGNLKKLSEKLSVADLIFIIRLFLKSYKDLAGSPNPQVPLLVATIEAAMRKQSDNNLSVKQSNHSAPVVQPVVNLSTKQEEKNDPVIEQSVAEDSITLQEVNELWPQIVTKVKEANGPLASLLKASKLHNVAGNKIVVSVKFQFDKQNLESAKNSSVIKQALKSLSNKDLSIVAQVHKTEAAEKASAAEVIGDVLKVFGGELVE